MKKIAIIIRKHILTNGEFIRYRFNLSAPGKLNLAALLSAIDGGLSPSQVDDALDSTVVFTQEIIGDLSEANRVSLIMSHFGLVEGQSTGNDRKLVRDYFTEQLKAGDSWGQIVYDAIVYLSGNPDPRFAKAAVLLKNKALAAQIYSQSKGIEILDMKFALDGVGTLDLRNSTGSTHINSHRIDDGATAIIENITEAATSNLSINRSNAVDATVAFTYLDLALQSINGVVTLMHQRCSGQCGFNLRICR